MLPGQDEVPVLPSASQRTRLIARGASTQRKQKSHIMQEASSLEREPLPVSSAAFVLLFFAPRQLHAPFTTALP